MTCNHADERECPNCAIPDLAWERAAGRCGGKAVFLGTRIPVDHVVALSRRGFGSQEIAQEYPQLTVGQIRKAIFQTSEKTGAKE